MSDAVIDRGAYWEVVYPDGSDSVPKDPNLLDSAAVVQEQQGNTALAKRLREYAAQIRQDGKPHPISGFGSVIVWVIVAVIALGMIFGKKGKK